MVIKNRFSAFCVLLNFHSFATFFNDHCFQPRQHASKISLILEKNHEHIAIELMFLAVAS